MTSPQVTWYGSQQESQALVNAIAHNCACTYGIMGVRLTTCQPHEAMAHDQRFLNGLLFVRYYFATHCPSAAQRVILMHGD